MQRKFYKNPIFYIVILVIGLASFLIIFLLNRPPKISIQNLDEINSSLSSSDQKRIEDRLLLVLKNSEYFKNVDINDIYIRPESYHEENIDGITEISFLVDIDSMKVTYAVDLLSSPNNSEYFDDVIVNCPKFNETKYPETVCHGMNGSSDDINLNLPYTSTIDGHEFTVFMRDDFYDVPVLETYIPDICFNVELGEKAEAEVLRWIKDDLYLNPDDYLTYTPTFSCS